MSKEIFCIRCSKYLGKIEPGSLIRKGTVYLCRDCHTSIKIIESGSNNQSTLNDFLNIFNTKDGKEYE